MTTQRITLVAVRAAAVLAMAVAASPASAAIILQTSADSSTFSGGRVLDAGASSASASSIGFLARGDSSASAIGGSLGAFGQGGAITYVNEDGGFRVNGASGSAHARFVVDDLVFSGPGAILSRVRTSMSLALGGGVKVSGGATENQFGDSGVSAHAVTTVTGAIYSPQFGGLLSFTGGKKRELVIDTSRDLFYATETDYGILSGLDVSSPYWQHGLTTASFDALLGVPLTFSLSLTAQGNAAATGPDAVGSGVADLRRTLTLPTSGPVFDLPAGFTVNSAQAQIVDNRWVGGAASSPVPEPSSFCIFGFGCLALLGYGWRRDCRKGIRNGNSLGTQKGDKSNKPGSMTYIAQEFLGRARAPDHSRRVAIEQLEPQRDRRTASASTARRSTRR